MQNVSWTIDVMMTLVVDTPFLILPILVLILFNIFPKKFSDKFNWTVDILLVFVIVYLFVYSYEHHISTPLIKAEGSRSIVQRAPLCNCAWYRKLFSVESPVLVANLDDDAFMEEILLQEIDGHLEIVLHEKGEDGDVSFHLEDEIKYLDKAGIVDVAVVNEADDQPAIYVAICGHTRDNSGFPIDLYKFVYKGQAYSETGLPYPWYEMAVTFPKRIYGASIDLNKDL